MRLQKYLTEERIELEFTREDEEEWAKDLAQRWNKKASFSFFTDAVIIDAPTPVMKKIRKEISDMAKKLKGLYINEAKKITVKDLPSMYHKDPLYKAVLMAKSKSEYDKALKTLKSIRGETAFRNFVAALKDANEVMDKARKKYESTLSEAVKLSKKEKKWFDKQTSGGRLFVPVHTGGDFEHRQLRS